MNLLQKPQIIFPKARDFVANKVREHLGDHFGVFEGNREILLSDGFPVHAAKLVNLVDEVGDDFMVVGKFGLGALDADFNGKGVAVGGAEFAIGTVTGVAEEEELIVSEVDKGSAQRHEIGPVVVEGHDVVRFGFVDGEDEHRDFGPQVFESFFDGIEFFAAHVFIKVDDKPVDVAVGGCIFLYLEDDRSSQLVGLVFKKTIELVEFAIVGEAEGAAKVLHFGGVAFKSPPSLVLL